LITEAAAIDGFPLHPFEIQVDRTTAPEYVPHKRHSSAATESEITRQTSEMETDGLIVKNDKRVRFQNHPLGCRPTSLPETGNICHKCAMHIERCKCKQGAAITFKEKEPESGELKNSKLTNKELRQKRIDEAGLLKVGAEPPPAKEIMEALNLLKKISESSAEKVYTRDEIEELQQ
jgi:hypothetical protein